MSAENIKLLHGDCLELMKGMQENSIDLVLTSPPYDNLRTYNDTLEWSFDIFKNIANEIFRITKEGGVVVWIVADATIDGSETGTSFRQALYFQEIGFKIHDTMIWDKGTFTSPNSLRCRYAPVFEYMFVFVKGKLKTFNPIKDKKNKRGGQTTSVTVRQKNGEMKRNLNSNVKIAEYGQRHNIWSVPACMSNKERTGHPAQFPVNLATDHIISWTNENDVVLDCFMGSGTTGVACVNANRNFIGIEKDAVYFEIAKKRIDGSIKEKSNNLF